jgi:ribosomal protein S18 acetylase RimI-like enzyme
MEFVFLSEAEAEDISAFIHDVWVDTYAPILVGGRERAESIYDDWVGPEKIRRDMAAGHFFAYPMVEGVPIGMVSAGAEGRDLMISKIYILPDQRGKGYGRGCLQFILGYGREHGCSRALLEVNPKNESAIRFYRENGFKKVGENIYEVSNTEVMATDLRRHAPVRIRCPGGGASSR